MTDIKHITKSIQSSICERLQLISGKMHAPFIDDEGPLKFM